MAAPVAKITVAVEPPCAFVRITGRAGVEGSRDFKALVTGLAQRGIRRFVLDLKDCLLMDSTFSGVLAGLVAPRTAGTTERGDLRFAVAHANERIVDLLDNLGVLPLVQRVDAATAPAPVTPEQAVPMGTHSKAEVAECCLEAHRILMALKPENVAKFRTLEQVLTAQLGPR